MFISREIRLVARDGLSLAATLYEPTKRTGLERPLCLVIINAEAGIRRSHYQPFAEHMAGRGCAVLTYDYRGIGGSLSGDVRAADNGAVSWGRDDFDGALTWAGQYISSLPVFVIAHGLGGQIVGLSDDPNRANEYLFIASGLDHWRHWPRSERMRRSWRYGGKLSMLVRTFGYLPAGTLANDEALPARVARDIGRWARHPRGAAGVEKTSGFAAFNKPITAYSFTDDEFTSPLAAEGLLACYPNSRSVHIPLTPFKAGLEDIGHRGFFDPLYEDHLWPRAGEWLRREIPLVNRQREEAQAEQRKAQGLPPKPSRQAVARARELRAIAGTEAVKRAAEAAAAAEAARGEAAAAASQDSRRMSRRRALRERPGMALEVDGVGTTTAAARRRASRQRKQESLPERREREDAMSVAVQAGEELKKTALGAISAALGKRDVAATGTGSAAGEAEKKERPADAGEAAHMRELENRSRAAADLTGQTVGDALMREQTAALARMSRLSPSVNVPKAGGDKPEANSGEGVEGPRNRFRRVPSLPRRGIRDTDPPEGEDT